MNWITKKNFNIKRKLIDSNHGNALSVNSFERTIFDFQQKKPKLSHGNSSFLYKITGN